jgi:hypothetical protein
MDDTLENLGCADTGRLGQLEQWNIQPAGFGVPQGPSGGLIQPVDDADLLSDLYLHMAPGRH